MLKLIMILTERLAVSGFDRLSKVIPVNYVLISAALVLGIGTSARELKAQDTNKSFTNLQTCLENARKTFPNATTDTGRLVSEIRKNSDVLLGKWVSANINNVPKDYLQTLDVNCELLTQATSETDTNKALALLEYVSDDLEVKAAQARNQVGSAEGLGASIIVSVKTRRNGREVDGYLVRCNPKRFSTQSPALFFFNNPTNQAERSLPPGNYTFWLETQGGQVVASRPIRVGGNGEKTLPTIWFDVP